VHANVLALRAAVRFGALVAYGWACSSLGGNAQYLSRDRWLHHTSFLWKCDTALFARYLTLPPKRPQYREDRAHADFVRTLDKLVPSKRELVDAIVEELETLADVVPISMDELARKRTKERSHSLFVPTAQLSYMQPALSRFQ